MDAERERVVDIAGSWVGTPYRSGQGIKGAGVDCGFFLLRVFQEAGLLGDDDSIFPDGAPQYKGQLARHRAGEQFYRGIVAMFADEVNRDPLPGDIVLFDVCYGTPGQGTIRSTHGAIVGEWPNVFHASLGNRCVMLQDVSSAKHYPLNSVWSYRGWCDG